MMVKEKKEKESKLLNLILNYFLKFIYDLLKFYEILLYKLNLYNINFVNH